MVKIGPVFLDLSLVAGAEPVAGGYTVYLSTGHAILIRPLTEDAFMEALTRDGYLDQSEDDTEVSLAACFTSAELTELKGVWSLGFRYIAKEASGMVFAYVSEPHKGSVSWINDDESAVTRLRAGSYDALSFEDIVPLHIGTIMEEMGS